MFARALLHANLRDSLLIAALAVMAICRWQTLVVTVPSILFTLVGVLFIPFGGVYCLLVRKNPVDYFMKELTKITNLAIGLLSMTPVAFGEDEVSHPNPDSEEPSLPVSPLPLALGSGRTEDTPLFREALRAMAAETARGADIADILRPLEAFRPPNGRHAKPEAEIDPDDEDGDEQLKAA
jgi:hypothetical protein